MIDHDLNCASHGHYDDGDVTVYHGDCLDVLRGLPDASVDAVVTDPPWLVRLVTPPGGVVLEPFAGSRASISGIFPAFYYTAKAVQADRKDAAVSSACNAWGPNGARCEIRKHHVGEHAGMSTEGEWLQWH